MAHPMRAVADHDERAAQLFTRDLKSYVKEALDPHTRTLARSALAAKGDPEETFETVEGVFDDLLHVPSFRTWVALRRTAQEMMWTSVADTVDRQLDALIDHAEAVAPKGSLVLDPTFEAPAYIRRMDTHLMPGGYAVDEGEGSIRQGAVMDAGGAVYQLGRPLGPRNDRAGLSVATHQMQVYPDLKPRRILDLGSGIGRAAVAIADLYPEAEIHAVDVGPSILRYAHARAEHMGAAVHFSQQNAEHTTFADASFDMVVSTAIFHETSEPAIARIMAESHRLLAPGGVAINIEVSYRYDEADILGKLDAEWETHFNNEPAYRAAISADYARLMRDAGFAETHVGYQIVTVEPGQPGFVLKKPAPFALYVASGRR